MKLAEMRSREAAQLNKDEAVVLIPTAAVEQHGDHLPLGTDMFITEAIAAEVERRNRERVVLLPCLWLGHSPHHMAFPGTVSVNYTAFSEILVQAVSSLAAAGFRRFAVLNGHGGNGLPIQMALQKLKDRYRGERGLIVRAFHYWSVAAKELRNIRESAPGGMGHACEMETSLMMHLLPGLVDETRIRKDGVQPYGDRHPLDMLESPPFMEVFDFHEISESGTFGDPTLASAEKGERFFLAAVHAAEQVIQELSGKGAGSADDHS